ncbi:MAG: hydroxymethylbilane synthase [Acidimicrobiia bacterium]
MAGPLRVATRASALARWQAERVAAMLPAPAELVVVSTSGDHRANTPIHAMGGTGVFVKEVQDAVLDGRADLAVHSAKDLPASTPVGLVLAAVPERDDPRDALVGCALDALPAGAIVGTGSVRRRAQLAAFRDDLGFRELRGNIATRLEKASRFDAVVVAVAALRRLGLSSRIAEVLDVGVMLPQVGQGALAVECRSGDDATLDMLHAVDDVRAHAELDAERAFLAELGGGCDLPCGALATTADDGRLRIEALLATGDGRVVLRDIVEHDDPRTVGVAVAHRLLDDHGGRALLEDIA